MKKFSLLLLSVLLLSCSSDDDTNEGNFLEVYNGVIWKGDFEFGGEWYVFTPKGLNTYIIENGCELSIPIEFGVANIEDGSRLCLQSHRRYNLRLCTITVLENSKDFLKVEDLDGNQSTFTVLENGDVLRLVNKVISLNLNKVSELCK